MTGDPKGRCQRESPEARARRIAGVRAYRAAHPEKIKAVNAAWQARHVDYRKKYTREWQKKNPNYTREYMKARREGLIGPFVPEDGPEWQQKNREDFLNDKRESTNRRRRELSLEALQHYSESDTPKCYCCGETIPMLLSLDHINGGGNKHRKEVGSHAYVWAKKNGWPPIFRVACHSCNMGAHLNGGTCPHQSEKP